MAKGFPVPSRPPPRGRHVPSRRIPLHTALLLATTIAASYYIWARLWAHTLPCHSLARALETRPSHFYSPYGQFPIKSDPFQFIPCTSTSLLPSLDDANPRQSWAASFDPDPSHWSWGALSQNERDVDGQRGAHSNRGIYLCGYLDLPLNTFNASDSRIVRIAITKYQVSGLVPVGHQAGIFNDVNAPAKRKSKRTIIIEPGGPGASGTGELWHAGEVISKRYSNGQYDVLGWDPRGVNASLPSFSCYPHDTFRDRWSFFKGQYRAEVASPMQHLRIYDAMNNATFYACHQIHGDFGRFVDTTFSARDLEEIRRNLGEDEVTGYFISYGAAIGVVYANLFPDRVGRILLDAAQYVRDQRKLGGYATSSLYNVVDTWRDGFLRECLEAGPDHCALATPVAESSGPTTLKELEARMQRLFNSLIEQPLSGYSPISGPAIVTYSQVVFWIYICMYEPKRWPLTAQILRELEAGDTTLAISNFEGRWYNNTYTGRKESSEELFFMVVCADAFDDPPPQDGLGWWDEFWANSSDHSWIAGSFRFTEVFACRHYQTYWPNPPGVYRGDLNHTLSNRVLVISGTHDPATPLKNGRDLVAEMGDNARLIVHHGYGHVSGSDPSDCTDGLGKDYILHGTLPTDEETHCFPNHKPYVGGAGVS
ncbi:unnamed protein product [Clonostachys byssicola]|uniref:Uncharacterized protein n=1 Tax=Clonostachys byssicola TaxID=160290 RepID=A0A9N9UYA9_9HYPO|nr:unnamed protein product [Clonostachys byssicola]